MNSLVTVATSSSKSASTKSSTCASHTAIQYEQIFSVKSSDITSKIHVPIIYPPQLLDSNIISPLATPQKEFSNLSIYSSIVSPPFDVLAAAIPVNTTFIKQSFDEQVILSPSTSSLLSSETSLYQPSPKSYSSPILSQNNFSSLHNLTPLPQLTHSFDDDLSMDEDHTTSMLCLYVGYTIRSLFTR